VKRVAYIRRTKDVRVFSEDGKSFTKYFSESKPTYEEALSAAKAKLRLYCGDGWYTLEQVLSHDGVEEIFSKDFIKKDERDYL